MLILYCTENVLLFLLHLIIFFVNFMGGPYASDLKRLSTGRNTFKLFYV